MLGEQRQHDMVGAAGRAAADRERAGIGLERGEKSAGVLIGEFAGTAMALYSLVRRKSGVVSLSETGVWLVMTPPTMMTPVTSRALSSPLAVRTNSASPIVPAAPPLLVKDAPSVKTLDWAKAAMVWRPAPSQPPPGLAGIITLAGSARAAPVPSPRARTPAIVKRFSIFHLLPLWLRRRFRLVVLLPRLRLRRRIAPAPWCPHALRSRCGMPSGVIVATIEASSAS
jgi:hypothetical protein